MESKRIVIIRIAGKTGIKKKIRDTLNMLRLYKKHNCVLIPNTQPYLGMLNKVRDHTTWGEVDEKTCLELFQKRAKLAKKTPLTDEYLKQKLKIDIPAFVKEFIEFKKEIKDVPGLKTFFKLKPPEGGFERKGIKTPFSMGGVLGYRKEKINELLIRML
jgi:large subunit ribosomal protein L30